MINKSNFKELLKILNFTQNGQIWTKEFPSHNGSLSVDFAKKQLIYPDAVRGRDRNTNFEAPENFVVFECVYRLLDK